MNFVLDNQCFWLKQYQVILGYQILKYFHILLAFDLQELVTMDRQNQMRQNIHKVEITLGKNLTLIYNIKTPTEFYIMAVFY